MLDLLGNMRHLCQTNKSYRLNLDNRDDLRDGNYISLTGLSKKNVHILLRNLMKNTPSKSSKTKMAILLCKLNSGLSKRFLATLFNLTKFSLRRTVKTARVCNFGQCEYQSRYILIENYNVLQVVVLYLANNNI